MTIHPKTSGAAVGMALGVTIVSVLGSIHGISLSPEANAAIPGFLATLGAWLVPGPEVSQPASLAVLNEAIRQNTAVAPPSVPPAAQ